MNSTNALYIVATPIGNLGDISQRAIDTLNKADIIAAEDTRHSAKLLQHFGIDTRVLPYHDHSNEAQTAKWLQRLQQGENVALISDAGTPLISDPGYRLVRLAREQGIAVIPIPGACAVVAALSAAGLPSDRFSFEGFLPAKNTARFSRLDAVATDSRTLIFYESPHRIQDSITAMAEVFGPDRQVVMAREISKTYETFLSATFAELLQILDTDPNQVRGEMVVMVQGYVAPEKEGDTLSDDVEKMMAVLMDELPLKQAAAIGAKLSGEKKNRLYKWAVENKTER
ncbi:16S rRNA (cytidine(1402)-2'-O)-methyltransferase [Teredinibacter haidensis]|uniref:16S rRNA (cytidine(1402)-2'-O)-methyltransferase n=1 Tax=Teredinibacter haidensis TaxID=2731755 RepID=UPI000948E6D8|nr:16S rRNA (cytidine(1402)-2'-O)-methyltransferase [Teredinibacter haidensis]